MAGLGDRFRPELEAEMAACFPSAGPAAGLFAALRYHLGWAEADGSPARAGGGKRLRPVLCLVTCEGYGGDYRQALPAAAAIELLHNFTLIHDDIEDRSDERHHRPTVWKVWGEAQAINAGDALFTISQLAALRLAGRGVPADRVLAGVQTINAACLRVCEGQFLDIDFEQQALVDETSYLAMIRGKTAALLGCALEMGALVAGAAPAELAALREAGESLGLAYQVQDDILGIWGDPAVTGKPTADDIRSRKKTLPIVHAQSAARLGHAGRLSQLLAKPRLTEPDVVEVVGILETAGSLRYAEGLAQGFYNQCLAALERTSLSETSRAELNSLVRSLLGRPV